MVPRRSRTAMAHDQFQVVPDAIFNKGFLREQPQSYTQQYTKQHNPCQGQFKIVGIRQSKNVGFGQFN